MNYIKSIPLNPSNNIYNVIIEIKKGSKIKTELDPLTHFSELKEVAKVKLKYPFYYGCFPLTLAEDKDPLDAIIITNRKYNPLDIVLVKVIGVFKTLDEGLKDDKVIVVPVGENIEVNFKNIFKFLKSYKKNPSNTIIDEKVYPEDVAINIINSAHSKFLVANQ